MLNAAALPPGTTVIEATSGNTGISLAALSAERGYRCIITMPENMSRERMDRMKVYGAQIVLTPAAQGMSGAVALAEKIAGDTPGAYYMDQFNNPSNPRAHFTTTGPEIWQDTAGEVDIFVAGVGTGGTISGVGKYLKQQNPAIQIVAAEPANGSLIPGLGAGFLPKTLDLSVIDAHIAVTEKDARTVSGITAHRHGLLIGPSSGAALCAAQRLATEPENQGKTIVALLPDTGCRYLSEM